MLNQEHCKSSPGNLSVSVHINPVSVDNTIMHCFCCPDVSLSLSLFQLVDEEKSVVMTEMEKLVPLCQQLQSGAKTPVQGKTATFQKVPTLRRSLFMMKTTSLLCLILHECTEQVHWGVISFVSVKTTSPNNIQASVKHGAHNRA